MTKPITLRQFYQMFPTDDACLEHLFKQRFGEVHVCPKCNSPTKFHRLSAEKAFSCQVCAHHIHPMVGTPFEQTHMPLQNWFYAMYLFTATRHGVSAKELQRQFGCSYKSAWRMGHEIRKYLADVDGQTPLDGDVEADETYVGGKRKGGKRGRGAPGKTVVFAMQDRDGDLIAKVVPDVKKVTLTAEIEAHVVKGSTVHTDELASYNDVASKGYVHKTVHHGSGEYVRDGSHVNSVEGFFSIIKRSIRSTHIHVSRKYLPNYLAEFEFRHNRRAAPRSMFLRLVAFSPVS